MIVNEAFARRYLGGRSPLGALICEGSGPDAKPNVEIIGVVADFRYRGLREQSEQAYFPILEGTETGGNFYVKVRGTTDAAFQSIRTVIRNADPALPMLYFRTMDEQVNLLQIYGQQYKDNWKGKSLGLVHGKIGFRTGNPKLIKNKKFTWDAVTELLKKAFPHYVRTSYEINKEALIACRDKKEFEEIKDNCYVDVVQDETFYVEANAEELSVAYSIHR